MKTANQERHAPTTSVGRPVMRAKSAQARLGAQATTSGTLMTGCVAKVVNLSMIVRMETAVTVVFVSLQVS